MGHYLTKDDGNHPFSGVSIYGINLNPPVSLPSFKKDALGLYDLCLGYFMNMRYRDALPMLEKYATKEQMASYKRGLYEESYRITQLD